MGNKLRLAVGIMGNAGSMLLFTSPMYRLKTISLSLSLSYFSFSSSPAIYIRRHLQTQYVLRLTFSTIIKKKSIQEFSCIPYIVALLSCLIYAWYGLPVVSCGWENFLLITINDVGILLESSFIVVYLWFAAPRGKVKVAAITIPIVAVFGITALISSFLLHSHHERKIFVGSIGLVASVIMYGSPLVAVKQVIETRSVKYMPFNLSFFSFLASSVWMAYGILSHDLFLTLPNLVGCALGIIQLVLYYKYRGKIEQTNTLDAAKNEEGAKQEQLVTCTADENTKQEHLVTCTH